MIRDKVITFKFQKGREGMKETKVGKAPVFDDVMVEVLKEREITIVKPSDSSVGFVFTFCLDELNSNPTELPWGWRVEFLLIEIFLGRCK